jgi:subfamily B ATP-binding cassette protein MsbA
VADPPAAPARGGVTAPATPVSNGAPAARRRPRSPRPLARLLPLARPYAGRLLVALVCLVVAALAGLAFPAVVRWLLDAAFVGRDRALLDRLALGLVLVFAVQGVCTYVQVLLLSGTAERVLAALRGQLFAHVVRLSPAFFTERRTGELTSRLSADLVLLQQLMNTWVSEFARQVLFLAGGAVLLTRTDPHLTLTTLAVAPVIVAVALVCGRALRRASAGVQDRVADAGALADEAFSQIRTVQGFVREAEETRRYDALLGGVVAAALARVRVRAAFFGVVGFVAFAGVTAVLWEGGRRVLDGTLTPGALVSFLFYAFLIAAAVGSLASLFGNFQEAIGRPSGCSSCSASGRRWRSPSGRWRSRGRRGARWRSRASPSATRPTCPRCCTT